MDYEIAEQKLAIPDPCDVWGVNLAMQTPPENPPSAPAHEEQPVDVLVGRWLFLGCAATAAVLALAFIGFLLFVGWGVAKQ